MTGRTNSEDSKKPISILVIGGSYGGIAVLNQLGKLLKEKEAKTETGEQSGTAAPDAAAKVVITLVEPKNGFLNVIGIPRCMVSVDFASTQYVDYESFKNFKFDKVISSDAETAKIVAGSSSDSSKSGNKRYVLQWIQAKVTKLEESYAEYQMEFSSEKEVINFDYAIIASGRDRTYPVAPKARSKKEFADEMQSFVDSFKDKDIISIVGAGAVGIELSSEIKLHFPEKQVNLIHPHGTLPPEPLSDDFKSKVIASLKKARINLSLNTRIASEADGVLTTTDGRQIRSDFTFWTNSKNNNLAFLGDKIRKSYLSPSGNLYVNKFFQLSYNDQTLPNIMSIGDVVELPIIKTAGWAMYMGSLVSQNIIELLSGNEVSKAMIASEDIPKGMLLVGGNADIISQNQGKIEVNNKEFVELYKTYWVDRIVYSYNNA
ncbi:Piso0_005001 [Millerozyma farinosa CBS 7064]|uniref:Piso0_005001 protein n=1 Tax=Pichia sorbitophila (strain ATCC MYA-4447 / BCRC 22081 / CBS 7064 / NBRC 10061 / NRRL Y-12695) TaxID=559304 RepID=G8Y3Y7_PICSO|nr:Piso0_005001 [Millerozyma farinosa CBS 7064]